MSEIPNVGDCAYINQGCFSTAHRMPDGRVLLRTNKGDECKMALSELSGQSPHLPETTYLGEKSGYDYFVQPYYERVGSTDASLLSSDISAFFKANYGWERPYAYELAEKAPTKTLGLDQGLIDAIQLVAGKVSRFRVMDLHFMNIGFTSDGTPILLDPIS